MKNIIIGALVAIIAIGGALGAFAATRTVETTANVEVTVWQRVSDGALYLSTRPEGGSWTTHNQALDMSALSGSGRFRQGSAVTVAVPVSVGVEVAGESTPTPTPVPTATSTITLTITTITTLKDAPNLSSSTVGHARSGEVVSVLGRDITSRYLKVVHNGRTVWMDTTYVRNTFDFTSVPLIRETFGFGESCLTTGCGLGYFRVPADVVLRVGIDIAPGKWNSDYESAGEDSCYAVRIDSSVKDHPGYVDDRPWTRTAYNIANGYQTPWPTDDDSWFAAMLLVQQPSGRYENHPSVIEDYSTDFVYGPRTVTITLLPTDYALIIDGECLH